MAYLQGYGAAESAMSDHMERYAGTVTDVRMMKGTSRNIDMFTEATQFTHTNRGVLGTELYTGVSTIGHSCHVTGPQCTFPHM